RRLALGLLLCLNSPSYSDTLTPSAPRSFGVVIPGCQGSTISPTSASIVAGGETGSITVSAGSACNWKSYSHNSWITITSGSTGTGNGSVGYSVGVNALSTPR